MENPVVKALKLCKEVDRTMRLLKMMNRAHRPLPPLPPDDDDEDEEEEEKKKTTPMRPLESPPPPPPLFILTNSEEEDSPEGKSPSHSSLTVNPTTPAVDE